MNWRQGTDHNIPFETVKHIMESEGRTMMQ